jgi:RNA polymerase sigma-70 factor (ECF subfamily)
LSHDEDAEFTSLVERQSRFVFRVAFAVLLNAADAEDAVQETFMKLWRKDGWRKMENERAFLARVAWRVAVDKRRAAVLPCEPMEAGDAPSPEPGPESTLAEKSSEAMVHRMIDRLPEELRLPLVLSAFEELNSRQIGAILGIPEGTVRTRLQRSRQLLRQKLASFQELRHA